MQHDLVTEMQQAYQREALVLRLTVLANPGVFRTMLTRREREIQTAEGFIERGELFSEYVRLLEVGTGCRLQRGMG